MTSLITRAFDVLFPARCLLCGDAGAGGVDLCPGCLQDLPVIGGACHQCGYPMRRGEAWCGACATRPPAWERLTAPLVYGPPVDWLVQRFKFDGRVNCGRALAVIMTRAVRQSNGEWPEVLVPVPLHETRLRERGFNQAEFLARQVGAALGIRVCPRGLVRVRDTAAQSGLPMDARADNVHSAFRVGRLPETEHVALVDDVLTTGHTATECVRALRRAGMRRVQVWTAARALRSGTLRLCA